MRFLGVIEGQGLYAEWNEKHNQIRYCLNGEYIAVYDLDSMRLEDPIIFRNNTLANELSADAKETIQKLARDVDVEQLKHDEEKYGKECRDNIGRVLNIEKKNIKSITEVDLDEEIEKKSEERPKIKEQNKKEKLATTKDIKIKQELKMDTMATSMKTIGQVLQRAGKMPKVPGKKFTKLGIVESDRVKDIDKKSKTNTTRFSFVAIANDGTVVPINLEQDHQEGNNPREISHRVNADGRVEQDDVNSRYRIGNSGETISIKFSNGPGNIEVGYSAHKTLGGDGLEGNVSIDHQLQTSTVYWKPRTDSRDQEYADGTYGAEEKANEANMEAKHEKELKRGKKGITDDDNHRYKDFDGDKQTKDSHHEFDLKERARRLLSIETVAESNNLEDVLKKLQAGHDKGISIDEVEEQIVEEAKEDNGRTPWDGQGKNR